MPREEKSFSPEPIVTLENAFEKPYDNAVAAARTCYSGKGVVHAADVATDEATRARSDAIAESIYKAGHHTVIQHATFQFVLDKVSRQFIWSFLHAHPYYNSEQVSQRYVEVKPENFAIPPLPDAARALYITTIQRQMDAYQKLIELVQPTVLAEFLRQNRRLLD